jgi:hypothetical protein
MNSTLHRLFPRAGLLVAVLFPALLTLATPASAQDDEEGGARPRAPRSAREAAPFDMTGQWVAIISEDWRWRMITPAKGDFPSIPMTLEAQHVAEAWDPAADEAAGEACKAYGAPGLMRGPIRFRVSWEDDNTLKLETDYGRQTRLFHFAEAPADAAGSWQGRTTAEWLMSGRSGFGTMKSVTTDLRPGYLRKNGVPYSAETVYTEFWDLHTEDNGDQYLVVTNKVEDPVYLQRSFLTAIHYKKEPRGGNWDPTACDARF